jgi:hypothetical protein
MVENIIQQRDLYKSMCSTTQKEATAMVAPTAAAAVQKKTPVKAAEGGSGDTQRVQAWEKNIIKEYNGFIYLAPPPHIENIIPS